jgi:hypothetical protein
MLFQIRRRLIQAASHGDGRSRWRGRSIRRPSAAPLLGAGAVFVALGGQRVASGRPSRSQIKRDSISLNRLISDAATPSASQAHGVP